MLHQDCQTTNPTPKKFLHAIRQNFDGFGGLDSVQCFNKPLLYGTEDMQVSELSWIIFKHFIIFGFLWSCVTY